MSTPIKVPRQKPTPKPLCFIPSDLVTRSVNTKYQSDFTRFLASLLGPNNTQRIVNEYRLGVTKSADVIFYQIDSKGRCRTGKVMKFIPATGHRIKDSGAGTPITWVHSLLKQQGVLPQEWELSQCLFGEHLLTRHPDRPVALVESEKTAAICACFNPDCVWLATGGKGQLNDRTLASSSQTFWRRTPRRNAGIDRRTK